VGLANFQLRLTKRARFTLSGGKRSIKVDHQILRFAIWHFPRAVALNSCFLSYCTEDGDFADHLYLRLTHERVRVWYAREHMRPGEKLEDQVTRAIATHDRAIIVISEATNESQWQKTEIREARKDGLANLIPISLVPVDAIRTWRWFDPDIGKDLFAELREYFIPDFSGWRSGEKFEIEFQRLLNALRLQPQPA